MRTRERFLSTVDLSRRVRPFEWGTEFVKLPDGATGYDPSRPREFFRRYALDFLAHSDEMYALPPTTDFKREGNRLTWTSAIQTITPENNTASARLFFPPPAKHTKKRAVVVLPQWNALADSHVALCEMLAGRFGIPCVRLTMPYHEERKPPETERSVYMVGSNVGRTLQSMRQAVLDARSLVRWLDAEGYERIAVMGTSVGSCAGFLTFVHEPRLCAGVFNHVSDYFGDVVWRGISTQHVREGIEGHITQDEAREFWLPNSPIAYVEHLARQTPRPMRFISGRYDLTFPEDMSRNVINAMRAANIPLDVAWLPCGHYTSAHKPWVYMDGWYIISSLRKYLGAA